MADAVVIGGTSGIGEATVKTLRNTGRTVAALGPDECDVRNDVAVIRTVHAWRNSSLWVYSAGVNRLSFVEDFATGEAGWLYNVNVLGFLRLMSSLVRIRGPIHEGQIAPSGEAHTNVVVVGSDAAERPMRTSAVYCGTKAALHQTARCLARELAPGFRINVVAPGMTEPTGMQEYIDATVPRLRGWTADEAGRYETSQIPMMRRADVMEVADVIVSVLLGPAYMTGSIVNVNGGR